MPKIKKSLVQSVQNLEYDSLLKEYNDLTQEQYDFEYRLVNFITFHAAVFLGKYVLSPWIASLVEQPELLKIWKEYFVYHEISPRYSNTIKYLRSYRSKFIEENCPYIKEKEMDAFVVCLKDTNALLDNFGIYSSKLNEKIKSDLKEILGKLAWFSFQHPNMVALDPEFQEYYPKIDYDSFNEGLTNANLKELIDLLDRLRLEIPNYKKNLNDRYLLNIGHLEGWSVSSEEKLDIFVDKAAVAAFRKNYIGWMGPIGHTLELIMFGIEGLTYRSFMNGYIKPKFDAYKAIELEKWTKQKPALINKKVLEKLRAETNTQRSRAQWINTLNFGFNAISATFFAVFLWGIVDKLSSKNSAEQENSSLSWSLIYDFIIFLYASYSLLSLCTRYFNSGQEALLSRNRTALNNAVKKVCDEDVRVYRDANQGSSLFFLPIKDYKRLSVNKVDEVIQGELIKHKHSIQCSNIDGIQHKTIAITLNERDNFAALHQDIEKSLKFENQAAKMTEQLEALCLYLKLNGQIKKISSENNQIIGEINFVFMRDNDAAQWKIFFEQHIPALKITSTKNQLELKVKLFEEEKFSFIIKVAKEYKERVDKVLCQEKISESDLNAKNKERMDSPSPKWQRIIAHQNTLAKKKKEDLRNLKEAQRKIIIEQQEIAKQNRINATTAKDKVTKTTTPYYFELNSGDNLTNLPYIKFSSELIKAFNYDKRMYSHFFKRAENGFITNLKGSIHKNRKGLRDFWTNESLIPTRKIRGCGIYKDVRAYAITTEEMIEGEKRLVYDVRSVSLKAHK